MTKLKAFTISELVVSMILTGIVISIAVTLLFMVKSQFVTFQEKNKTLYELNLFKTLLNKDFEKAEGIIWDETELSFKGSSTKLTYIFDEEYIVRNQSQLIDTFLLRISDVNTLLLDNNLVVDFSFDIESHNKVYSVHFRKQYAPSTIMNHLSNNNYIAP